jgi:hypothetical protein
VAQERVIVAARRRCRRDVEPIVRGDRLDRDEAAGRGTGDRESRRIDVGRRLQVVFRISYELGARRLAVEHVVRACPNDPALAPASFESPERLPACGAP